MKQKFRGIQLQRVTTVNLGHFWWQGGGALGEENCFYLGCCRFVNSHMVKKNEKIYIMLPLL